MTHFNLLSVQRILGYNDGAILELNIVVWDCQMYDFQNQDNWIVRRNLNLQGIHFARILQMYSVYHRTGNFPFRLSLTVLLSASRAMICHLWSRTSRSFRSATSSVSSS